jgi:phenylpropionate dioxygenase-like ring-hydroxylating dioxygenase large terminal subunit
MTGRRSRQIPAGWYLAALSEELGASAVLSLQRWGRALVLFRNQAGQAHLLAAHCPHLGAHLGHGGRVSGEQLVCPFHGWEFEGGGRCARIPYADRVPARASLRAWPLLERDGLLMAWFDPSGGPPS